MAIKLFGGRAGAGADEGRRVPAHIAIILDGNGRWAKKRGLPRTAGHAAGSETFRRIATYCRDIGMQYLTVYAFSTENWKRPKDEVDAIMGLLNKYLLEAIEKMERDRIRLKFLGDTTVLSPQLQARIEETNAITARMQGFQTNVCLNYGGRDELVRAAEKWAQRVLNGETEKLTEERFAKLLWSEDIPDPDLLIRPGGEQRLSNFLLWQSAYTELLFTDTLWPDFTERDIDRAIEEFYRRERRFGGI